MRCFYCSRLGISAEENCCGHSGSDEESFEAVAEMGQPRFEEIEEDQNIVDDGAEKIIRGGLDCTVREFNLECLEESFNETEVTSLEPDGYLLTGSPKLENRISTAKCERMQCSSKQVSRDFDAFMDCDDPDVDDPQNDSKSLTTVSDIDHKSIEICSAKSGENLGIQCEISQDKVKELGKRNWTVSDFRDLPAKDQDIACQDIAESVLHSNIHRDDTTCNDCQKHYADVELHEKECTCVACNKKFQCETQPNEFYYKHLQHFETHCWNCNDHFKNHWKKLDEKLYVCCFCEYESPQSHNLISHYNIHRPNSYCSLCKA